MATRSVDGATGGGQGTTRLVRRIPWLVFAVAVALGIVGMVLVVLNRNAGLVAENAAFVMVFLTMGFIGALIASRHPRNAIGWLFLMMAFLAALSALAGEYARYALVKRPGSLPGGVWAAWLSDWMWLAAIFAPLIFVLLLFPNGRLLSPRWKWVALPAFTFTVFASFAFAVAPRRYEDVPVRNPLGFEAARGWAEWLDSVGFFLFVGMIIAAAASVIVRFRRSSGEERQQLKWFAYAAGLMAAFFAATGALEVAGVGDIWITTVLGVLAFMAIPVAAGIAILRYRLYDIDVVIKKTVVFGAVALFITGVYVAVVVGLGTALAGSRSSGFLTFTAAAIMAVAFQPVRDRARHFANRLVYGKRATPYEVLSQFSERVGGVYSTEDVLPRMARIVGEGTGAARALVWLRVGQELRPAAGWPELDPDASSALRIQSDELPSIPDVDRALAVRHRGELLGALTVAMPPNEPLTPPQEKLLGDLASQAGLVLRNVRLTAELRANLDELRASRQRIVAAQDEERRRLERNIHDGAQQQLVALAVKLRLAEQLAGKDSPAGNLLSQLQTETADTLQNLRDLARGIYPPLLSDQGIAAALSAQARKAPLPVEVDADGVGRYPQEAEAAVYFCCLEALQNIAKYAEATNARISLYQQDGELRFAVSDDGKGFDPETTPRGSGLQNMSDRLAALGGRLEVASQPGEGATVSGTIPVGPAPPGVT